MIKALSGACEPFASSVRTASDQGGLARFDCVGCAAQTTRPRSGCAVDLCSTSRRLSLQQAQRGPHDVRRRRQADRTSCLRLERRTNPGRRDGDPGRLDAAPCAASPACQPRSGSNSAAAAAAGPSCAPHRPLTCAVRLPVLAQFGSLPDAGDYRLCSAARASRAFALLPRVPALLRHDPPARPELASLRRPAATVAHYVSRRMRRVLLTKQRAFPLARCA